jgi:GGDEF domain-containing protein
LPPGHGVRDSLGRGNPRPEFRRLIRLKSPRGFAAAALILASVVVGQAQRKPPKPAEPPSVVPLVVSALLDAYAAGRFDDPVLRSPLRRAHRPSGAHLAQHDVVTGLPNRLLLHDRLAAAIAMADRRRKRLAVGFLDLDGFKQINDSLGHATADPLLQSVATRLRGALRRSDTICRSAATSS